MQRITQTDARSIEQADAAVLMFGAPAGAATHAQALEFADAWADSCGQALFAYADALDQVALARAYAVRVLPTIIVLRQGETVARFEGVCTSHRILAALAAEKPAHAHAA